MKYPLRKIGAIGTVTAQDSPAAEQPPTAFTRTENVSFYHASVAKAPGWSVRIADLDADGLWFQAWETEDEDNLVILSEDTVYTSTDGVTLVEAAISGAALGTTDDWQTDVFGQFCIINNGVGTPKYSSGYDSGTDEWTFDDLVGWAHANGPNGKPAVSVRAFNNHLVALGIEDKPYTVHISHIGSPEAMPTFGGSGADTWNTAAAGCLARSFPLQSKDGKIVDGGLLNDRFMVYQRTAVTALEYVGGQFVINARRIFDVGLINRDAWVQFDNWHFCVSETSMYIHDGSTIQTPDHPRVRHQFFAELGDRRSVRVTKDAERHAIIIYYATSNGGDPDRTLTWNYEENTWAFASIGTTVRRIAPAVIPSEVTSWAAMAASWGSTSGSWASFSNIDRTQKMYQLRSQAFDERGSVYTKTTASPSYLLLEPDPVTDRLKLEDGAMDRLLLDEGELDEYDAYAERTYLDMDEITGNAGTIKRLMRITPQIAGSGVVDFQVGVSNTVNDPVRWKDIRSIDLDGDPRQFKVDVRAAGRYLHWRIGSWNGAAHAGHWQMSGMDLEIAEEGMR